MKKTDLEKNKGLKIASRMAASGVPARFGGAAAAMPNRREQRKADQAAGLMPFACKLDAALIERVRALATERGGDLNGVVTELLTKGLEA